MPKGRSDLFTSIQGSMKDGPTFRRYETTPDIVLSRRPVPTDHRTAAQAQVRNAYSHLGLLWRTLTPLDKEPYEIIAERERLTSWNAFLRVHLPLLKYNPYFYIPFVEGTGYEIHNFALWSDYVWSNNETWDYSGPFPGFSFPNQDFYMQADAHPDFGTDKPFTCYFLLKTFDSEVLLADLADFNVDGDIDSFLEIDYDATYFEFYIHKNTGGYLIASFEPGLQPNTFYSIAVVVDETDPQIYLNGTPQPLTFVGSWETVKFDLTYFCGYRGQAFAPTATLHTIAVLPGALTAAQVAALDARLVPLYRH